MSAVPIKAKDIPYENISDLKIRGELIQCDTLVYICDYLYENYLHKLTREDLAEIKRDFDN